MINLGKCVVHVLSQRQLQARQHMILPRWPPRSRHPEMTDEVGGSSAGEVSSSSGPRSHHETGKQAEAVGVLPSETEEMQIEGGAGFGRLVGATRCG